MKTKCLLNSRCSTEQACPTTVINKGIEFIDLLPTICRDKTVVSSITSYFENTESPSICYKYNKPIRNTILNFNKCVSDLDIGTSSPDF